MAKSNSMQEWEAEDDLHTVLRAREIRNDKTRMARVRKLARQKADAMKDVGGKKTSDSTH